MVIPRDKINQYLNFHKITPKGECKRLNIPYVPGMRIKEVNGQKALVLMGRGKYRNSFIAWVK
jgi:hypothetical protein